MMKHLFEDWGEIASRIQKAPSFHLLLGYDGTLAPIASRPDLAVCPPEVRDILESLKEDARVFLVVVSGRSVQDLFERIGVSGVTYVGNHGLEILNPAGFRKKVLSLGRRMEMAAIRKSLEKEIGGLPGILFEDRESILAVHYRMVPEEEQEKVLRTMEEIRKKWASRWNLGRGKMVFEIRPRVDFHKGKAVRDLLGIAADRRSLPFYFGDDVTDEEAFRFLREKGITVLVGPPETPTEAEYFLGSPAEVKEFLERFKEALPGEKRTDAKTEAAEQRKMVE